MNQTLPMPATPSCTPQPLLRVRQLGKRYGALTALHDASFDLWPGEVLAVVGESGSGKSDPLGHHHRHRRRWRHRPVFGRAHPHL